MKKDRLRQDSAEIHNLDDLIEARSEGMSHISRDLDAFGEDLEINEEVDVDQALTFPHPKRALRTEVEQSPTDKLDEDWDAQDSQPTDYEHLYNEGSDAHATDDMDQVMSDEVHHMSEMLPEDLDNQETTELPESHFHADEETGG